MGSAGETQLLRPTASAKKKLKALPTKILDACGSIVVNHSSVPRKLRSVMKKRSCKHNSLMLLNPKKFNELENVGGSRTTKKKGFPKKSKLNLKGRSKQDCVVSPKQAETATASISKDEEEVANTLSALAGMIPGNGIINAADNKCESPRQLALDVSTNQHGGPEYEGVINSPQTCTPEHIDTMEDDSKASMLPSKTKLLENMEFSLNATAEDLNIKSTQGSILLPDKLTLERSSDLFGQDEALGAQTTPANNGDFSTQKLSKSRIEDDGSNLSLCLNLRTSHGAEAVENPSNYPSWLGTNFSSSKAGTFESRETEPQGRASETKKRRRCTTHVYVSNLIRSLKISEDGLVRRPYEEVITDLNPSSSQFRNSSLAEKKCSIEALDNSLVHKLSQEQEAFRNLTTKNQQFDFLSLSLVKDEPKANCDAGVLLNPFPELSIPQLMNSVERNGFVSSLSNLAPSHPLSHRQHNKHSTFEPPPWMQQNPQAHVLPPLGSPLGANRKYFKNLPQAQHDMQKRPPQPSEYQNPIWAAQVPSYQRSSSGVQLYNWKNNGGRQDPCLAQYIQSPLLLPPTHTSSESVRSVQKYYLPFSQPNHQQVEGVGSVPLPHVREKIPCALWL